MSGRGTKARQEAPLAPPAPRKLRCAVYTRKSSEEGLEQAFNSLDAQREACEAYVLSQRAEGWLLVPDRYDDGGVSGGTLERPALRRLLADIEAGRVDLVVVYKIDRLSRALMDFARLVEVFDRHQVTFVSVTQAFNTTTSMGRLTLNVLLSFAQFEREVIGERIRDKFAASRCKGMWMGGTVPFGYVVRDRKLVIQEQQAATVRTIFERFARVGSATTLAAALAREGVLTPRGKPIDKGFLYKLLTNRVYVGEAVHKGMAYPGEHEAIVTRALWDKVHAVLQESPRKRAAETRSSSPALLKGLIFGPTGCAMSPTHTRKGSFPSHDRATPARQELGGSCSVVRSSIRRTTMHKLLLSTAFAAVSLISVPAFAETAATEAFAANVRLNAVFLAKSSDLAADHSDSAALKAFAGKEAVAEAAVVTAIDNRALPEVVQSVPVQSGPMVVALNDVLTGRSAAIDAPASPAAFAAPAGTGALMPAAMIAFDHLSSAKGEGFDALYKATQVNALRQLAALYNAYSLTGDDVALRQMAIEQLAAVNGRIAEIGRI